MAFKPSIYVMFSTLLFILPVLISGHGAHGAECTCEEEDLGGDPNHVTLRYKIGGIFVILVAGAIGVCLPIVGKSIPGLRPGGNLFFMIKAFAAGVILSTGFIHVLPEAFEQLTSPCLKEKPWQEYPFTGLAAMVGALGTLFIDALFTGHFTRSHMHDQQFIMDEETKAPSHSHGVAVSDVDRVRYKVASQVLEIGIVVHSVIIGISLGTSQQLDTIKPLMAALCFHQCFEGIGLGGIIAQADFKLGSILTMVLFFSFTTPVGVAVGIGIMKVYDESSPTALIVQGILNSCAAGILIYMALVDLLAQDFMSTKMQSSKNLFFATNLSLLLGVAFMSVLAIWA